MEAKEVAARIEEEEKVEAEMEHFHFLLANCENHGSLNPQNDIAKQKWGKKRRKEKKKTRSRKCCLCVCRYVRD